MSEIKVNKISPRTACGTVTLGDSGDTFTIPSGATITNAGTASGFGATGETSWDTTVKTTGTFTATAGVGYFLNTTGGIITVNLPAGAAGSSVALADYARTWQTNNVTVTPNGSEKIGGGTGGNSSVLSIEGQSVTFVYIDGTQGWVNVIDSTSAEQGLPPYITATVSGSCNTLTTSGDFKIATFKGPGTFCVSAAGSPVGSDALEDMVVAGGGGAGGCTGNLRGGAGAGGFRFASPTLAPATYPGKPLAAPAGITASVQAYPIVVGGGGAGSASGAKGSDSTFSTITSSGGGDSAGTGGSGGGSNGGSLNNPGGSGNTPPVSPPQGNNGGASPAGSPDHASGGGGGGIAVGATAVGGSTSGAGGAGAGIPNAFSTNGQSCGSFYYYAGGGGGAANPPVSTCAGAGGLGGGGAGASGAATAGTNFTGGGGGAGGPSGNGGNGGGGIVVIRYQFQ